MTGRLKGWEVRRLKGWEIGILYLGIYLLSKLLDEEVPCLSIK